MTTANNDVQVSSVTLNPGGGMTFGGSIAEQLMHSGFRAEALRPMTTLRKDEWEVLDQALIEVTRQRLRGVGDLMSRGLTYNLGNALGVTRLEWETVSDMNPAEVNMSGLTEAENDRITYGLTGMPIPIIHKDFHINIRALSASRNRGEALDTTQVRYATRKVSEMIESLLFSGGYSVGAQGAVYGYTNYPNRNTDSVTATWVTATGAQILADVLEMIGVAQGDFMWGPYVLYVPEAVLVNMSNDYKAESDKTILQRVLEVPGISAVLPSYNLSASNVVLVQMTSDVVDMVNGMQPTVLQWESHGGMMVNFKVMAIMVPRMKADDNTRCGIVHYS